LKQSADEDAWQGPRPLPSFLDVARLGEIYSRTAAFYDGVVAERQAGPKLEALRQLDRRRGERFLEVGCGTGWAFSRLVAESGTEGACGIDVAAGMLDVARQAVPGGAMVLADGRQLPFASASFDCLLNTYTFEVLATPDIGPVLDECLRVLRPGGRIAVVNLTDGEGEDAVMTEDWKRRYVDDPEFFGGARPLHLQAMLEARGFVGVRRTYVGPAWPSEVLIGHRPG